jgi:hypothetical protein
LTLSILAVLLPVCSYAGIEAPPASAPSSTEAVVSSSVPASAAALPEPYVELPPLGSAFASRNKLQRSGHLSLFAGQFFFEKNAGSINGYADFGMSLSKSYSADAGFVADLSATYTGFKQVNELVGGGTLFQQSFDAGGSVKWLRLLDSGAELKPRLGFKYEFFRDTNDESWGKGLYDYWRAEAGIGWEKKTRLGFSTDLTSNVAYDFYYTAYPNYVSLGSQFGTEVGAPNPGTKVLDNYSHNISYRGDFAFPGGRSAYALAMLSLAQYPYQRLVNSNDAYESTLRHDLDYHLTLGGTQRLSDWQSMGRLRPFVTLSIGADRQASNQNHFDPDPSRLKFIDGFYDYDQIRAGPTFTLMSLQTRATLDLSYQLAYRRYTGRLTQDATGLYNDSLMHQAVHTVALAFAYPIGRGLELQARANWARAVSNTDYQAAYVYDYTSYNYFGVATWKF